jgi:hypothetical protein
MDMHEFFNSPEARANAEKLKQKARLSIAKLKPKEKPWATVYGLDYLTAETIEIVTPRVMEWFDKNPWGEPMYCRTDNYQYLLYTNQITSLINKDIRTAQRILAVDRIFFGKPARSHITVIEFCCIHNLPEDDIRLALTKIKPNYSIH